MKKSIFSFVVLLAAFGIIFSGCDKNWTDNTVAPSPYTPTVKAIASYGFSQNPDSTHSMSSITVDSALINRLLSFYAGRSTGNIVYYQHSIIYTSSVDSSGGIGTAGHWFNRNFTQPMTVIYRLKVFGTAGTWDTSSTQFSLRLLTQFGGGPTGGVFSELSLFQAPGSLLSNGMRNYAGLFPKNRTANGGNGNGYFVGDPTNWQYKQMQSLGDNWRYDIAAYDGQMKFQYTGNYPTNWWSIAAGSIYKLLSIGADSNQYGWALRGGNVSPLNSASPMVQQGDSGDTSWTTGSLRWSIKFENGQWWVVFYFNNRTIPGIAAFTQYTPTYKYKLTATAEWTTGSQLIDNSSGYGKLTLPLGTAPGSHEFRLLFMCNGVEPAFSTSSMAWSIPDGCFYVNIFTPTN